MLDTLDYHADIAKRIIVLVENKDGGFGYSYLNCNMKDVNYMLDFAKKSFMDTYAD